MCLKQLFAFGDLPLILIDDDQGSGVELELADARSLQWEELFVQTVLSETHQVQLLLIKDAKKFMGLFGNFSQHRGGGSSQFPKLL